MVRSFVLLLAVLISIPMSATVIGNIESGARNTGDTIDVIFGKDPVIDGKIGPSEWTDGRHLVFDVDGGSFDLYLKETGTRLYIATSFDEMNMVEFYFDVKHDGGTSPGTDDFMIHSSFANWEGKGDGSGWVDYYDPRGWNVVTDNDYLVREGYIDYGRLDLTPGINSTIGFMFCAYVIPSGDVIWPSLADFMSPDTWGDVFSSYDWGDGSSLNRAPVISDAELQPTLGTSEEGFSFSIRYMDEDGDPPLRSVVVIDGTEHPLSGPVSGLETPKVFGTTVFLDPGQHEHHYLFDDGTFQVRFPFAGNISGPRVERPNVAPVLVGNGIPSGMFFVHEDGPEMGLIDLEAFFEDDRDDGHLEFELVTDTGIAEVEIDSSMLNIIAIEEDWSGWIDIQVEAFDHGIDGLPEEDHRSSTKSNVFSIEVRPVNDPPRILMFGERSVLDKDVIDITSEEPMVPGEKIIFQVEVDDPDAGSDTLRLAATDPRWNISRTALGFLACFVPEGSDSGEYSTEFVLTDDHGSKDVLEVVMDVEKERHDPLIDHLIMGGVVIPLQDGRCELFDDLSIREGTTALVDIIAEDMDIQQGEIDMITYILEEGPEFVQMDAFSGRLTISPDQDHIGFHEIVVDVQDINGDDPDDRVHIEIEVVNVNDAPEDVSIGPVPDGEVVPANGTITLICAFVDRDLLTDSGDSHVVQWSSDIDGHLGIGSEITLEGLSAGDHRITVRVTDSFGAHAEDEITITFEEEEEETDEVPIEEMEEGDDQISIWGVIVSVLATVSIWVIALLSLLLYVKRKNERFRAPIRCPVENPAPSVVLDGNIENGIDTITEQGGNDY